VNTAEDASRAALTAIAEAFFLGASSAAPNPDVNWSMSPQRGMVPYRGVGPSGRGWVRDGGGGPGRTAIQRNPAGSFAAARC